MRELDTMDVAEKFQMLCMCQEPEERNNIVHPSVQPSWGCKAIRVGSWGEEPLLNFFSGRQWWYKRDPFCGRSCYGRPMQGGIFKGRHYCRQHYEWYAICDTCFNYKCKPRTPPCWVDIWEFNPRLDRMINRKDTVWQDHGMLQLYRSGHDLAHKFPLETVHKHFLERCARPDDWLLRKSMWLCESCRDDLDMRLDLANTKRRKSLTKQLNEIIKQEQALKKGKETYKWIRKYLKNNAHHGAKQ